MDKKSLKIARKLKKEIEKEFKVLDMRIFGSRARDDYEKGSDLDICIVLKENNSDIEDKVFDYVWKIGFENDLIITTIIFSKDEIEKGPMKFSPIYKSVMREGIAV